MAIRFVQQEMVVALLLIASVVTPLTNASAQSPAITSAPSVVAAGPDYAHDTLGNPWDFSDVEDLTPYPDELGGWTISATTGRTQGRSAFLSGGNFVGRTTTGGGTMVGLLYRGGGLTPRNETSGFHDHKAIRTASFGKLSVAVTYSASTAGQMVAFWWAGIYGVAGARGAAFNPPRAGTHIYTVDLVTGIWYDERGNTRNATFVPAGNDPQVAWNSAGLVRGFSFRPTSDGNAQVDVSIDWIRITQRDGAPGQVALPITFSGCAGREYNVEVQSSGGSWDVIHAGTAGAGSTTTASVNYGVLPPGNWPFRVSCFSGSRTGTPASSSPVNITINAPPTVAVLNPDALGGTDWATAMRSNPWDWNAVSDAEALFFVTNPSIVHDGVSNTLQATGTSSGDPIVTLINGTGIVDTTRFRNLTFSLELDTPFALGGPGAGSVARVFWERPNGSGGSTVTTSQDILVWPGRNTFQIDLSTLTLENGGLDAECFPSACNQAPWTATPTIRYFRIDPHESTLGVRFRLGPTFLTTNDEVVLGSSFPMQYFFTDADGGGSYQARIYIDTDRDAGTKTLLDTVTSGVVPNTPLTYQLNPAALSIPAGDYYIFVEIIETRAGFTDTRGLYSTGLLRVLASGGGLTPPGPPSLSIVQSATNPATIAWSPGPGGAPTRYTAVAGTSPGAANLGTFNLGLMTQVSGNVPPGVPIYIRIVATNAAGSAASNEIVLLVGGGPPGVPTMNAAAVSGSTVSLSWNPPTSGGAPTHYILVGRIQGNPTIIATLPIAATAVTVGGVGPGNYAVSVVAVNAAGMSAESAAVPVIVR